MFKSRLKETGEALLGIAMVIVLLMIFVAIISDVQLFANIIFCMMLIALVVLVVYGIYRFVMWLFVEPYQNWKRNRR